ncbi:7191_t:CDS:2, partial [Paraglomus brasilianum]
VYDCYNEWMANEVHQLTPAGHIQKTSYATVAQWVKESWDNVDSNLIRKAFKCCGILVNMDGTEDELVFDYEGLVKENSEKFWL